VESIELNWASENWSAWKERYGKTEFDHSDISDISERIEILASRTGLPTVRVMSPNGRTVFLHSSVDPVKEAQRMASRLDFNPGTALLVFGFGLGYYVEALLGVVDELTPLFVVEPDKELFCKAMKSRDLRSILSSARVYILVGDSPDELQQKLGLFYNPARNRGFMTTGLSGQNTVYAEYREKVGKIVADVLNAHKINLNTLIKLGPDVISSGILNLVDYYTSPGVRTLFDRFSGMPAIIVSAGPSLNKNIHLLHEAKGKAVILAVGTAVRALQKYGIEPDFIVSIDPAFANYKLFNKIRTDKSCLITEMQSYHQILKEFQGPKFVMGKTPISSWYNGIIEDKGNSESGGSVANNALSIAYKMGADPIVLVGQDLAYSDDGHSHASGTNYENNVITGREQRGYIWVKANNGGEVKTDGSFYLFLTWFERWFRQFPDREYINATEGGAKLEGTTIMTLREVIDQYCTNEVDVKGIIATVQELFTPPRLGPLYEQMKIQKNKLEKTIKETIKAMKHLKKLEIACEHRQGHPMQKHFKAVSKIYEQFIADPFISVLPEWMAKREVHGVLYRTYAAEQNQNDDFSAAIADYTIYYEKMLEATRKVKELINTAIQEAERRMGDDEQSV
jgi:hypothetical protein